MIPKRLIAALKTGDIVLFLGAGANYNCKMANGENMPTGDKLNEILSKKYCVKKAPTLSETAEFVEAQYSRAALDSYLMELFTGAIPSDGFKLISSFKWSSIYTTNYDLLVEDIYRLPDSIQKLKVYYTSKQQIDLGPDDVPLYKLHGCISRADTFEGRLVITPDDYTSFKKYRSRLYGRLADNLSDKPFLYIGYSRLDSNFRSILADVHDEMNGDLPEGYALAPGKLEEDNLVWNKKGVILIDMDVDVFLSKLNEDLKDRDYSTKLTYNFPLIKQYEKIIEPDMRECLSCFTLPIPEYGTYIQPSSFYKGAEAQWIDIQKQIDAERDIYEEIMENLFQDALSMDNQVYSYCILAEAGTGKSTLLRRLAYDLCNGYDQFVLWYRGERRIHFENIEALYRTAKKRVFVFVDRASKYIGSLEALRRDCKASHIPVTIVVADRTNEWQANVNGSFLLTNTWTLGKLSDDEIIRIIDRLEKFDCLVNLKDLKGEQRIETFRLYSDRQLLVALRQATEGRDFDELLIDEYQSIPNAEARRAYLYICAIHTFSKGIRTTTLIRSLGITLHEFSELFKYLDGLVIYKDDMYSTRHALIATVIFFSLAEATRIEMLEALIKRLDIGYMSDNNVYKSLSNDMDIVCSIGGIDTRRRLFDALKNINLTDAFIEQHEARMEIKSINDGGSLDRAEELLKNALKRTGFATSIRHTLGLLYIERANHSFGAEKRAYISTAISEFTDITKRDAQNEYAWVSLIETRITLSNTYSDTTERMAEYSRAEEEYQKSIIAIGITPYLLRAKGKLEAALGHGEDARNYFKKAISGVAPPANLFSNYIRWELRHKNIPAANEASKKAYELYKTNADIIVLRMKSIILGGVFELSEVVPLFHEALRVSTGYYKMEAYFWAGVAYWENDGFLDAMKYFKLSQDIAYTIDRGDIKHIRYISGMNKGIVKEYIGSIVDRGPRNAWVVCRPGGVRVYIKRKDIKDDNDNIKMKIGFNWLGPTAISENDSSEFLYDNIL